jgi:acyl transferase domain-containing protein
MTMSEPQNMPIAVIGVSALFPGSAERDGFWRNLLTGADLIEEVPASHWLTSDYYDADPNARDKVYAKRGGFLPGVTFDPMSWGVPPTIMPATDTTQLLALIVAQRVLDDAIQGQFGEALRERTSVILGVTSAQELLGTMVSRLQRPVWTKALREMGMPEDQVQEACGRIADQYVEWQESSFPGVLGNVVAGRIANRLDLGGSNCVTDAACASSFSAISMGINELRLFQSDLVIAGGADTMNDIFMYVCFSKTPALSPTGDCRPFSDKADGTLLGEGIGMVALKRLADAEANGDRIYAVLKGLGSSSDGRSKSVYAPVAEGQARALRRAYDQAGYGPETVGLLEAHGTGTKAGDAAEFRGLNLVFDEARAQAGPWCALGSIKSQIGHTKAAAGAAGLFKVVMALHHKVLPPTIKVDAPNPKLELDKSPFYLNTASKPWIQAGGQPRRASVSSFGFGGSNFHLTLEEYRDSTPAPRLRATGVELVLLTADTPEALAEACGSMAAEADQAGMLRWLAYSSQQGFDATADCRLAVLAEDEAALLRKLDNAATMVATGKAFRSPTGIHFARGKAEGDVAVLFSGQGSQYLGMGADVAMAFDEARAVWDRAAGTVEGLAEVVFPPTVFDDAALAANATKLTQTQWAQPAIGAMSLSLWSLLRSMGLAPSACAGHSFGEVTALVAASSLSVEDGLVVARRRGELMAEVAASTPGAMRSVRGALEDVEAKLPESVVVANHNAPQQVVISGPTEAVEAAGRALDDAGLSSKRLEVSTAFHSSLVASAVAPFRSFLDGVTVSAPNTTVTSNTTAAEYPSEPGAIRDQLANQLGERVRFVEQVERMFEAGVRTFVEVGPGHVLTQLVGRILGKRAHRAIALDRRGRDGVASLFDGIAQLAVAGRALDFSPLWKRYAAPIDPRTVPAPKMAMTLTGSNYGKLYPPPGGAAALPKPNDATTAPRPLATPPSALVPSAVVPSAVVPSATAAPATRRDRAVPLRTEPAAASSEEPPTVPRRRVDLGPPQTQRSRRPDASPRPDWLEAFEIAQQQAAQAQASFERTLAQSHANYLAASQESLAMVARMLDGHEADLALPAQLEVDVVMPPRVVTAPPADAPRVEQLAIAPVAAEPLPVVPAVAPASIDLTELMLTAVAESTGYPREMLGLEMNLEADLGIDSIKRVEILSAVKKRAPNLPDVPTSEMAKLSTLGAIVELMGGSGAAAAPVITQRRPEAQTASGQGQSNASVADLEAIVLAAVADKTGYPVEMLGLGMELEADLGIDSIKRVEILSAVRNLAPELPDFPTQELATLRTLGEVVARMRGAEVEPAAAPQDTGPQDTGPQDTGQQDTAPAKPGPPAPGPKARAASAGIERRVVGTMESPRPDVATPGLMEATKVAITASGGDLALALANELLARGVPAEVTDAPTGNVVVLLPDPMASDVLAAGQRAVRTLQRVAPAMIEGGTLVTVQRTGGAFLGEGSLASASLVALARCARAEWPRATVRAIDIGGDDVTQLARELARELLGGGREPDVGLGADGRRRVPVDRDEAVTARQARLGSDDVVLASGGARGVTAASLVALAKCKARFVLLGRTQLVEESATTAGIDGDANLKRALLSACQSRGESTSPAALGREVASILASREIASTLQAIERAGGEAIYRAASVTDVDALEAAVAAGRERFGPITALVHGAGVLADKAIIDKTPEQVERVLRTKIDGLEAMLEATSDEPLAAIVLFSSVAARFGNAGQCDYAMANEILNKRARALAIERPGTLVRAIGWGPWRGGMVNPSLATAFESAGVDLIDVEEGAAAFVAELERDGDPEVIIGSALSSAQAVGRDATPARVDVYLDDEQHPALLDHAIAGRVVLPVAMAVEVFRRALAVAHPTLVLQRLSSLQVLRGIKLDDFAETGAWLSVEHELLSNGDGATVAVRLLDREGSLRYRAVAEIGHEPPTSSWSVNGALDGAAPATGATYGGVLFHGPAWQVIERVSALGPKGAQATLRGAKVDVGEGALDVGLIDGALQLALLWTQQVLGGPSLPTAVETLEVHRLGSIAGVVRATLVGRQSDGTSATCDVHMCGEDGLPIATLRAVATHALPRTAAQPSPRP